LLLSDAMGSKRNTKAAAPASKSEAAGPANTSGPSRPWEHRLAGAPHELTAAFVQSLDFDTRLYPHDVAGSIAHARMLSEVGLITAAEFKAIKVGLEAILADIRAGKFVFDVAREDIHMAIEAALIERIGEPGKKLHTARSRNDQVATDFRLWVRAGVDRMDGLLAGLMKALLESAEKNADTVMPGFTHVQHAQPVAAGQYYLSFIEQFARDRERLADCRRRVNRLPLGAGALAGTSLPISRRRTAELLGFEAVAVNSIDAVSDRDFAVEYVFVLSLIGLHLSRWAEDGIMWIAPEFGFHDVADMFCTGSSMMPQKKNPDVLELIRGRAAGVQGCLTALTTLLKAQPTGYNRDLQEDKRHVFLASDLIEPAVQIAAEVVRGTSLRAPRLREHAAAGFMDATLLAEYLVGKGVPFREAHGIVGRLVKECEQRRLTALVQLPVEEMREFCPKVGEDVKDWLGPDNVIRRYRSEGSAGTVEVRRQIERWKKALGR
jgi:argininosuccinate lyase